MTQHLSSESYRKLTTLTFHDDSTRTADPTGNQGVPILVDYNPTFNYAGNVPSLIGPQSTTRPGPAALVEVTGTSTYNFDMIMYGLPPIAFQNKHTIKNNAGVARKLTPSWSFISAPGYVADGATVQFRKNDVGYQQTDYWAQPLWHTINNGTIDGATLATADGETYTTAGFTDQFFAQGNVTIPKHVAFQVMVPKLTDRVAGWDAVDGVLQHFVGLEVPRVLNATTSAWGIKTDTPIWLGATDYTDTASGGPHMITTSYAVTMSGATNSSPPGGWDYRPTFIVNTTLSSVAVPYTFKDKSVYKSANNNTDRNLRQKRAFWDNSIVETDGNSTDTMTSGYYSFVSNPTVQRTPVTGAGTMTIAELTQFRCVGPVIETGCTVTTRRGIHVQNSSGGGTVGTNIGIDIDAMSDATVNIGVRNRSRSVYPPSSQVLSAGSNQISATSSVHTLSSSAGDLLMTSTPTIATGEDGQLLLLVNTDTTDTITLQDQGTLANSNLRLAGPTFAMGPRDSSFFIYFAAVGDWVQLSQWGVL